LGQLARSMSFSAATLFFPHPMDKLSNYFRTTIEEMRYNVTWPSTTELQKSAGLVLIGSLVFAVVVGVMDISFESILKAFYNSFR
jgi:preprotein translocase subunit SecE